MINVTPRKGTFVTAQTEIDDLQLREKVQEISLQDIAHRVTENIPALKAKKTFAQSLERHGIGMDDVARTLADIIHSGTEDHVRLRATQLVMQSLGILSNGAKEEPQIVFQIAGGQVNLQALLHPNTPNPEETQPTLQEDLETIVASDSSVN